MRRLALAALLGLALAGALAAACSTTPAEQEAIARRGRQEMLSAPPSVDATAWLLAGISRAVLDDAGRGACFTLAK